MFKYNLILFLLASSFSLSAQTEKTDQGITITSLNKKTTVYATENGALQVNVSPKDVQKFKTIGVVRYRDFGAEGDGKKDDIDAIAATHAFANQYELSFATTSPS